VVRNPCEPLPARSADPEVFLWAARLAPYKHPELYVELARAVPEARFRMVCVPTSESEHAELGRIRESALALPNLELLQARPRRELLELISSAVAVVNTADFEGMANVLLEAWAQGVPALVLTHDPDGVIAREGLGAFADGSFDRLAELARELWEHRGDQSQLAARCRAYVAREHSEDAVVDRWLEVLGFDATATTLP
jgi:glycosyltransferase involved in cell wall biosynthesis